LNPHPDGRRAGDTERSCLTSKTSCSCVYNIEYKLYICIYDFCKIKKSCRARPALRAKATAQAPHVARAGLTKTLLNGSCFEPARQARPIWPYIPPHDNDGPRLSCHHLVRHSTFSLSHLMPPPPRHPILVFIRHQPRHRLAQWILHVHEDVSHHAHTIVFTIVGRPVRIPGFRPVLPPQPAVPAHGRSREPTDARRRGYGASRSCPWPFSMRVVEEDMVAPATLRLSWQ
jgi:hypothetical protein